MNYTVVRKEEKLSIHTAAVYPSPYHKSGIMEYVQFIWKEPVVLRIRSEKKVENAVVRPLSLGITPRLEGGEILIALDHPVKLSLEINGGMEDNLLVLAEEERYEDFQPERPEVIYFPAGVHQADILSVGKDNTVIYLEKGAYVHGKIVLSHCSHVTVCGYGVISMEQYPYETRPHFARCVDAIDCHDVTVRDITIMDSNDWSLRICGCEDVFVDNVKIFGCRGNSDGVDVCGSRRVLVQNVFTRVWDDSLVVKALDTGDVEDVTFRNCVLWNDFARPMEVGVELRADRVHGVRFENIDVLHSPTGYPLMGIHHGDRAVVSDIVFENIRIEDAPGAQLFDVRITPSYWNRDKSMGCIRDVVFRDIHMVGKPGLPLLLSDSRLQGYDEIHDIRGVTFENIDICGKTPGNAEELHLNCMDHVDEIKVIPNGRLSKMQPVKTRLELSKVFALRQDGFYEGEVTIYLRNQAPFDREKEVWLKISPEHLGIYDRERKRICLPVGEETCITYPVVLQPGKYVLALQAQDPEVENAWEYVALDWQLTVSAEKDGGKVAEAGNERLFAANEERRPLEFLNYWGDRLGQLRAWIEDDNLVIDSDLLMRKDCVLVLYAAWPVAREQGEVLFSVEETDFGQVPAILDGQHGPEAAPQLRCPLEITLVFKNHPKVREIRTLEIQGGEGNRAEIALEKLGFSGDQPGGAGDKQERSGEKRNFWIEIEARVPEVEHYRYPYTLFHSVMPLTAAHMYGNCVFQKKGEE